ncbi:hypothetical protein WN865_04050 [Tetragenococcus halophilus]
MKKEERAQIEQNKKNLSIKSMYFNRYLLIRYVSALFFFTNTYWLVSLLMSGSSLFLIPLTLMIIILFSVAEQIKILDKHTNEARYTKCCFAILLIANVLLVSLSFSPSSFTRLYPFLINQVNSQVLVLSILVTGILLSGVVLYRLFQIKNNNDKHYKRIQSYEEVVHS